MRCWWTVQDEASNTITLPLCSAHHSLGRASPTPSAGSRCPGGKSGGECQGEPSDVSARAHATARAPPGCLQGTTPRRAPRTRGSATRATVPSVPGARATDRSQEGTRPGGSARPGAGADLGPRWTVGFRPREQACGHQGQEVSTETAGSSLAPGHSQQGHGGSPAPHRHPHWGSIRFTWPFCVGEGSGLPLVVHSRFPDC